MKADVYMQRHYWATIELPGDGLLALLARSMIDHAHDQARPLCQDPKALHQISCKITLSYKLPASYVVPNASQDPHQMAP